MFTGIVEDRGEVVALDGAHLSVRGRIATGDVAAGDSIAVNGTCLTVTQADSDRLSFDLSDETLARTALGRLRRGDPVNLERAVTLVARLGGHLVQGHVDGVGEVTGTSPEGDGGVRLAVRIPAELLRFVVEKGSIALDGVSLTVAAIRGDVLEVALIPHTLAATTLGSIRAGDPMNVEVDLVAKYVAKQTEQLIADHDPSEEREERTAWTHG
jgi:riboflavin synthase